MRRTARAAPGGMVLHALDHGVGRMGSFQDKQDYDAFQRVTEQTLEVADTFKPLGRARHGRVAA